MVARKVAGGSIPHTIDETDPESVTMEAYRTRHQKGGTRASGGLNPHGHVDPVLLQHVREILTERKRCHTILELAEETARRMGGTLPDGATMYPQHPSRLAIADCVGALWETGELTRILDIGEVVAGGSYLWLNGDEKL